MNNQEILTKAIEKAVKNGYEHSEIFEAKSDELPTFREIIFSHDFAKAFFGNGMKEIFVDDYSLSEELVSLFGAEFHYPYHEGGKLTIKIENWKYNIQQMVLEPYPIRYLEKFL